MKIIADQQIPYVTQAFSEFAKVTICNGREITAESIQGADVLLVRSTTIVNAGLLKGSEVKFVASATSGLDHIDLNYLQENDIGLAHAQGSNARSVAEYIFSSLFVLADQYNFDFRNKTIGIIGCGAVGSSVIKLLETMGVKIIINDPPLKNASANNTTSYEKYHDLPELFSADIITLHIPLTKNGPYPTYNLVDKKFLSQLNDDTILFNTARGGVIDEVALKNHLANHEAMKVVLDVWEDEPNIDLELLAQSTISTSHIAGYSTDGKIRATKMIFESICNFFKLDYKWNSTFELSDTNNLPSSLVSELNDQDVIRMAVLASYDVRSDSAALKCLPEIDAEQRSHYFDELRKNYPVRREFPATVLELPKNRKILIGKLQQLGFNVKTCL